MTTTTRRMSAEESLALWSEYRRTNDPGCATASS